jgi:hypothetical protein
VKGRPYRVDIPWRLNISHLRRGGLKTAWRADDAAGIICSADIARPRREIWLRWCRDGQAGSIDGLAVWRDEHTFGRKRQAHGREGFVRRCERDLRFDGTRAPPICSPTIIRGSVNAGWRAICRAVPEMRGRCACSEQNFSVFELILMTEDGWSDSDAGINLGANHPT